MSAATGTVLTPYPSGRQASATFADAYGSSYGPRTATAGTEGTAKSAGASSGAPITINGIGPDFLRQPAGGLVLLIGALLVLRYLDGRS